MGLGFGLALRQLLLEGGDLGAQLLLDSARCLVRVRVGRRVRVGVRLSVRVLG